MSTLTITTYQSTQDLDREEQTDFPIQVQQFTTEKTTLKDSIEDYLLTEVYVVDGEEEEIEPYMSSLTLGEDGSLYREEDEGELVGYSVE